MEAKELRIGNYTYYTNPHSDRIVQEVLTPKDLDYAFSLDPIPLTEEWLIKLGFGKSDDHVMNIMCVDDELSIEYDYHFNRCFLVINTENNTELKWLKHIQYVHQLQNLYFALTGK